VSLESDLKTFVVKFFTNSNLHSEYTVEVDHVKNAVSAAIKKAEEVAGDDVSRFAAAILHPNGEGVSGVDDLQTKSQLQAQLAALQDQLNRLEPDEKSVTETVPNVQREVSAPPVSVPEFLGPNPGTSQVSAGTPVTSADAPGLNAPVSQAEIDAAVANRTEQS
jgi:hypothetical protein